MSRTNLHSYYIENDLEKIRTIWAILDFESRVNLGILYYPR